MKNRTLYLCPLFLICSALLSAPPQTAHTETHSHHVTIDPGGGPVTVPVNVAVHIEPNIQPHNLFQPGNTVNNHSQGFGGIAQSQSTATNTTVNTIRLFLSQKIEQIKAVSPRAIGQSAAHWGNIHKKQILLYSAGTGYVVAAGILIHGTLFMRKSTPWASWKKQLSMEELLGIPQDQLGTELIHAIQQRHVNVQNPTDHITPLVRFVQAVDREMKMLNRYILLATSIRRCRLMRIFPTNNHKIEQAQELKQRLGFVKHTFISWAATDNLANFNH